MSTVVEFWWTIIRQTNRLFALLAVICFFGHSQAQGYHFDFNSNCKVAFEKIFALNINGGKAILQSEKAKNPENLSVVFLENYIDFVRLFVSEEEALFNQIKENKEKRLELFEKAPDSDPWKRYCLAETNLQWAVARSKFKDYLTAFREAKRAYKLHKENATEFPEFLPTYKTLGLMELMIGTLPDKYQWGAKLLGFSGTLEGGLAKMNKLKAKASSNNFFEMERRFLEIFVMLNFEKNPTKAWGMVSKNYLPYQNNLFNLFLASNVAMNAGKNDEAINMLEKYRHQMSYFPFPYLDFTLGTAKLRRLDKDSDIHLLRFTEKFKGVNFIKEAYHKVAWHHLINGNKNQYYRFIGRAGVAGQAETDSDILAQKEAESNEVPHPELLKARLLSDGGYFSRAEKIVQDLKLAELKRKRDKIEFHYRKARIFHALQNIAEAKTHYLKTIEIGLETNYYFAASAYYQMGLIEEKGGSKEKARTYYRACIRQKNHPYANSLQQKARSGLNRL